MFTLGYSFRPWRRPKAIADGPSIRSYIRETAREHGVDGTIRFHHRVVARRVVHRRRALDRRGRAHGHAASACSFTCGFLFVCTGYYRYDEGYTPHFEGIERFGGRDRPPAALARGPRLRRQARRVIGSGATAVTLVPAMAEAAAHVTMLQRSPSYVLSLPGTDPLADLLRRGSRRGRVSRSCGGRTSCSRRVLPGSAAAAPQFDEGAAAPRRRKRLPEGYDVDTHFTPRYEPWDQRLCLVPDGDLFEAISAGRASVVTDRIETFTETGSGSRRATSSRRTSSSPPPG